MKTFRLVVVLFLMLLAACTQESGTGSNGGKIAAVVNGVEITRQQVDFVYRRSATAGMSQEDSANLKRQILSDLVRIELLAGKAKEMKLDKDRDYSMALYSAQKTVLAGFAENKLIKKPEVSSEAEDIIIQNNQLLFSGRKMYIYDELLIPGVDLKLLETLNTMANQGSPMARLVEVLNAKKVQYRLSVRALSSENIPQAILVILNSMKQDQPRVINAGGRVSILLSLRYSAPIPLTGVTAKNTANAMIAERQRAMALTKTMDDLLNNAKITYFDEFAEKVTGKRTLAPLPVPDTGKAEKLAFRKYMSEGILSGQIVLAVMAVTAMMRSLYSKLWLPRLWPHYDVSDETRGSYSDRYQASRNKLIYLYGMAVVILGEITFSILRLWSKLMLWEMLVCVAGGLVIGFLVSRLFVIGVKMKWTRMMYSVTVGVLTFLSSVGVLLIKKTSIF